MGIVPSRRVLGAAILASSELQCFGVKSLRRYPDDGKKLLVANSYLGSLILRYQPDLMVILKLEHKRATNFNLQLLSAIKGLADSHHCRLVTIGIRDLKSLIGDGTKLRNQRQLAGQLSIRFPELGRYLANSASGIVKDREKYYQPMFAAIAMALCASNQFTNNQIENTNDQTNPPQLP